MGGLFLFFNPFKSPIIFDYILKMKNALDEIKCVPVLGGMKPPYQISSHPYCIDIITSYVQLSKFEFKTKTTFL